MHGGLAPVIMVLVTTCPVCEYNLPHHDQDCAHATPLTYACLAHRPAGTFSRTDDARGLRCGTCGETGAHGYR